MLASLGGRAGVEEIDSENLVGEAVSVDSFKQVQIFVCHRRSGRAFESVMVSAGFECVLVVFEVVEQIVGRQALSVALALFESHSLC